MENEVLYFEELEKSEELCGFCEFMEGVGIGLAVGGGIGAIVYIGVAAAT